MRDLRKSIKNHVLNVVLMRGEFEDVQWGLNALNVERSFQNEKKEEISNM